MRSRPPGVAFVAACAALLLVALSGCAACPSGGPCGATARGDEQAATRRGDIVCTNETVTGSRIIERRCRRRSVVEERQKNDRAAAERLLIKSNTPVVEP